MNTTLHKIRWIPVALLAAVFIFVQPKTALGYTNLTAIAWQDTIKVNGKKIVIIIDDDGRVHVETEEPGEDEPFVFQFDPDEFEGRFSHFSFPEVLNFERRFRSDQEAPDIRLRPEDFRFNVQPPGVDVLFDRFVPGSGFFDREFVDEHREIERLEREVRDLAGRVRSADESELAGLESELKEKLDNLFDKKLTLHEKQVNRLEERLQEEQHRLSERRRERENIVDRRLRDLLGEEDILDW